MSFHKLFLPSLRPPHLTYFVARIHLHLNTTTPKISSNSHTCRQLPSSSPQLLPHTYPRQHHGQQQGMQDQTKSEGPTDRIYKMSPHQIATSGLIKMARITQTLVDKCNGTSAHISGGDLKNMLEDVNSCFDIHLRAFEATKSTGGEKATDDPSTSPFIKDTLDYKSWNVTEVRIVLHQLKLDVGKAKNTTKEVWDEMMRDAKAVLPADMNLSSCVVTIGIILTMLRQPELEWANPHGHIWANTWIEAAAMYEADYKISVGGVLRAIPAILISSLRDKLIENVEIDVYLWPRDVTLRVLRETFRDIATVRFSRGYIDTDTVGSVSPADIWLATRWADEAKRMNRDICDVAREFNGKVPEDLQWNVDIVFGNTNKRHGEPIEPSSLNPKWAKTIAATDEAIVEPDNPEANTPTGLITTKAAPAENIATEDLTDDYDSDDTVTGETDGQIDLDFSAEWWSAQGQYDASL